MIPLRVLLLQFNSRMFLTLLAFKLVPPYGCCRKCEFTPASSVQLSAKVTQLIDEMMLARRGRLQLEDVAV